MTTFLQCMEDGFTQVRDEDGLLMGVVKITVPASATIVTDKNGQVFQLGMIGMPGILCREDQDPTALEGFQKYEAYKPKKKITPETPDENPGSVA